MGEFVIHVYMIPECGPERGATRAWSDFIPTEEQCVDILKLYVNKGLVRYSEKITREENRLNMGRKLTLSEGFAIELELTDNFEKFLETNGFLEWFEFMQINGDFSAFPFLDIVFYDPFFAPYPSSGALEKFNKLVASDPRDTFEVAMDTRYIELNPRYDMRYSHFDDELTEAIGDELGAMGIIDGIRSIIGMDVKMYSERLRE